MEPQQTGEQLSRELSAIHADAFGTEHGTARVFVHDDVVFCLLDGLELLPAERILVENGEGAAVLDARLGYQEALETTLRAAVERATGRRVVAYVGTMKLGEQVFAVDIFRLAS